MLASTSSHSISNFSGSSFDYSTQPTYNYYRYLQPNANLISIVSENQSVVGTGTMITNHTIPTNVYNGKSQYLFTAAELQTAGVTTGDIDGFLLNIGGSTETAVIM